MAPQGPRTRLPNPWVFLLLVCRFCALAVCAAEIALVHAGKRQWGDTREFYWVNLSLAAIGIAVDCIEIVPLLDPTKKIPRVNPCGIMSGDLFLVLLTIPILCLYTVKPYWGESKTPTPDLQAHDRFVYALFVCMFAVRSCLLLWGCIRTCFWPSNRKPAGKQVSASEAYSMVMEMDARKAKGNSAREGV